MIRWAATYFGSIPAMFIDGTIYFALAILTFLTTNLGTDEAAKYVSPAVLFWLKTGLGAVASGLLAIKMFRSTAYADHQATKTEKPQ